MGKTPTRIRTRRQAITTIIPNTNLLLKYKSPTTYKKKKISKKIKQNPTNPFAYTWKEEDYPDLPKKENKMADKGPLHEEEEEILLMYESEEESTTTDVSVDTKVPTKEKTNGSADTKVPTKEKIKHVSADTLDPTKTNLKQNVSANTKVSTNTTKTETMAKPKPIVETKIQPVLIQEKIKEVRRDGTKGTKLVEHVGHGVTIEHLEKEKSRAINMTTKKFLKEADSKQKEMEEREYFLKLHIRDVEASRAEAIYQKEETDKMVKKLREELSQSQSRKQSVTGKYGTSMCAPRTGTC